MKETLIASSILILAVLVIRRVFQGVLSRRVQYGLWALVLARLLVPAGLLPPADFSLLTATQPVQQAVADRVNQPLYFRPQGQISQEELSRRDIPVEDVPTAQDGFVLGESEGVGQPTTWLVRDPETNTVTRYDHMTVGPWEILNLVWRAGMIPMGGFFLLSNLGLYVRLRKCRREWASAARPYGVKRKVYLVAEGVIPSPCLFGRSIYITPSVAEDENKLRHVLTHEETHARHLDPLWSLLRCVCLTVYWFDPLVWLAAACSRADCELACDESVLKALGEEERIPYGQTLLSLIPVKRVSNPMIAATTMTAGKKQLKDRVKRIAGKPRQLMAAALAVAVLAAALSACTFTSASLEATPDPVETQEPRSLTGEELRWFNEEFFNRDPNPAISYTYSIRNQFINSAFNLYERPEDIDLFQLFYCEGDVYDDPENDVCLSYKITAAQIDAILTQYTGLTLEQTNKVGLENFTYQDGAYCWSHGDTNYPGDIEIICGTREDSTVKLYHHGWSSGSTWYCTTLEAQPGGGYWFVSNQESEAPAIPTPLPAWEPETVISLKDLKPYVAPTVTVEPHPNHYTFHYKTCYANWSMDDHHIMVYRASDDVVYAAYVEDDVYYVFQSGLEGKSDCVFFYHDLLGHDGFWLDYYGFYEGSSNFRPIRDYYYFDGNGVLTLLARCRIGYEGVEPSMLDLDGDGKPELVSPRQLFFERDGAIYEARLDELVKAACPELSYWDYSAWDKYSKCLYIHSYSEEGMECTRYLYFDGENILVYKNEKSTTDHMVDGADKDVPQAVVSAARAYAQERFQTGEEGYTLQDGEFVPAPVALDDWRVDYFYGPYTYSYGGATVEGWWFNYEMHTTTPENVSLAGGRYLTEDGWFSPGYPGCDALFFEVKADGSYALLDCRMVQESPESYYVNEQILRLMEERGMKLTDGSSYAKHWFQKRLDRLTDPVVAGNEMRLQYDDGQGKGGAYLIDPQEGNGPYYLGQMKENYVVWSRAQAPAAPTGATVILSDTYWHDMLQFWQDSGLVMYKQENREPEWYEVRYEGDPTQDVFAYRAFPYYWARCWFDEVDFNVQSTPILVENDGHDYTAIAQHWASAYEGIMTQLLPGGNYTCTFVKVANVKILENQPESWFPWEIRDDPHFAFSFDTIFVPENEDALNTLMAGNTGAYQGSDPDVPEGAFEYSRVGSMYLRDGVWHFGGGGTG